MSFVATVRQAKELLRAEGRVSLGLLKREFGLDDAALEALVVELVDVQQLAAREGKVLSWFGPPGVHPARVSAVDGERRQLTVLFCDLVDSTRLAAGLDPEDWSEVVRAYQESAGQVIARFEGHVAQYLGDGLLVYFGYPHAHEDDAERAVRAGLGIVDALGALNARLEREGWPRLSLRVGIHTGPVVLGEMGGGERRQTLALGDTTNVAARLQAVAQPDTLVLSDATLRLVPGAFVTEDLGGRDLKGLGESRAHRVLRPSGLRSRLEAAAAVGLTPLVGREQEQGLLVDRWEQMRDGAGQAVLVTGEAGVGKSRLVHALGERLADVPHTWLECRCSAWFERTAFHPVTELLKHELRLDAAPDAEARWRLLEEALEAAGLDVPAVAPGIAELLFLPVPDALAAASVPPEVRRRRTLDALAAWTIALAHSEPVVLDFEDLQWCDPSSLELLGLLLERLATARILLVLTARPGFQPPWPSAGPVSSIVLNPLTRRQSRAMVLSLTREHPLPENAVEEIVTRSDGNPLYVEELTRLVSELAKGAGGTPDAVFVAPLPIPATLQDSLMARLDRLGPAKEVAQLCATLGRDFPHDLLAAVSHLDEAVLEAGLVKLARADLLHARGTGSQRRFVFKHALIRDAAHASLLKSRRQEIHGRIARKLEERFSARIEEKPELAALHCEEAGLVARAIHYLERAGARATARLAHHEAILHLRRALELLGTLPEGSDRDGRELRLQVALGVPLMGVRGYGDAEVGRTYQRALDLAPGGDDAPQRFDALWGLGTFHLARGELEASMARIQELRELAERRDEGPRLLRAHLTLGQLDFWMGRFEAAVRHLERTRRLYERSGHPAMAHVYAGDPVAIACFWQALALWEQGHPGRALERAREGIAHARTLNHPYSLSNSLAMAGVVHHWRGEPGETLRLAEEGTTIARESGFPFLVALATAVRGCALVDLRGGEAGIQALRHGLGLLAGTGTGVGGQYFLSVLARAQASVGRETDALATIDAALALSERQKSRFWDAELLRIRAELLLQAGRVPTASEAEAFLQRALATARQQGGRSLELRAATSLARLWQRQGKRAEARDLLQPVYAGFIEGFETQDLKDAKALLEQVA